MSVSENKKLPVWEPSLVEMESLFVNNASLEKIKDFLNRFNPIKTMKMERMEIRHSAILAWLLNPAETHGLGDRFLKAFICEALRGKPITQKPTALHVSRADLSDAEIRTEWLNIDILAHSPSNGWVFIIENKYDSNQREGQLTEYSDRAASAFKSSSSELAIRGIFLSLWDEEPEDGSYATIRYQDICEILSRIMIQQEGQTTQEVWIFVKHYLDLIKEATGMSDQQTEMESLARQLYREHRKVLDFVIEHGAGTDFAIGARQIFGENSNPLDEIEVQGLDLVFYHLSNRSVGFVPVLWHQAFVQSDYDWQICGNWWCGFPLVIWFEISSVSGKQSGTIKLHGEVGPIPDYETRKALIMGIEGRTDSKLRIGFGKGALDEGRQYSRFFKNNSVIIKDVQNPEEISDVIKKLLIKFQPEMMAVSSILPSLLNEIGVGQNG